MKFIARSELPAHPAGPVHLPSPSNSQFSQEGSRIDLVGNVCTLIQSRIIHMTSLLTNINLLYSKYNINIWIILPSNRMLNLPNQMKLQTLMLAFGHQHLNKMRINVSHILT